MSQGMPAGMPPEPESLDSVEKRLGYRPGVGPTQPEKKIHTFIIHEQGDPLYELMIQRTGLSPEELQSQISKAIERARKEKGIEMYVQSEDWQRVRLVEKRLKPKGYLCEYTGSDKALARWRNGETVVNEADGSVVVSEEPHLRTWGGPAYIDLGGQIHEEKMDRASFEQHWAAKNQFSSLEWLPWEKFKELR